MVGNACGGKPGSHGSKVIHVEDGAITIASPHTPASAAEYREPGLSNAEHTELQ